MSRPPDAGPPSLSLPALGRRFLRFGALAWGGPVVQIASLHRELVERERWVDEARFRQALAVYQVLPGPEATELCIWFGTLARGRLGGLVAGLAFVMPGLLLMLLLSWLLLGLAHWPAPLVAAFAGMQAAVVALVARAAWRLFGAASHRDPWLGGIAITAAAGSMLGVPFAASLVAGGLAAAAATLRPTLPAATTRRIQGTLVGAIAIAWLAVGALWRDETLPVVAAAAVAGPPPPLADLLGSGLRAGLLTFGGAYTAIPFLQADAVGATGWMTQAQFLQGLAVGGVIPAPMVVVGTWVGFAGGGLPGALLLSLGIFLPAFAFPILLHGPLERLVRHRHLHALLDGVTAAVAGLVLAVAANLVATLTSPLRLAVATGALLLLSVARSRFAVLPIMATAALAGLCMA